VVFANRDEGAQIRLVWQKTANHRGPFCRSQALSFSRE
jgi:hypothetical protein